MAYIENKQFPLLFFISVHYPLTTRNLPAAAVLIASPIPIMQTSHGDYIDDDKRVVYLQMQFISKKYALLL